MFQIICTSYNETEQGLVLRNNWIEENVTPSYFQDLLGKWEISNYEFQKCGSVSKIYTGKMQLDKVVIHIRVVRF
jgi:hypothetical protein